MERKSVLESRVVLLWALVTAAALLSAAFWTPGHSATGCGGASAQTIQFTPSNYCWFFDTTVTNNSGSDATDFMARIAVNTPALIAGNQLDPLAWTVYSHAGNFTNAVTTEVQELADVDSHWWVEIGDIPDGESRTVSTYFKNAQQQRDQGIRFTGREVISLPDDALTDGSANGSGFAFTITVTDDTPRDEIILDKMSAINGTGWAVTLEDDLAGGLLLVGYSNASSSGSFIRCPFPFDASWIGERRSFALVRSINGFGPNDVWFFDEDALKCNADGLSIGVPGGSSEPLEIGDTPSGFFPGNHTALTEATIHDVWGVTGVSISNWISGPFTQGGVSFRHLFDPLQMDEFTATEPTYTGTFTEINGLTQVDATYSFVRPQTGFVVNNGSAALTSGAQVASSPDGIFNVAGNPFDSTAFENTENTRMPFYGTLSPIVGGLRMSREAAWLIILFMPAFILGLATMLLFPQALAVVGAIGLPYAYGVAGGLVEPWWLFVWAMAIMATWGLRKWERQS